MRLAFLIAAALAALAILLPPSASPGVFDLLYIN